MPPKVQKQSRKASQSQTSDTCGDCSNTFVTGEDWIRCGACQKWYHKDCQDIDDAKFEVLSGDDVIWGCNHCNLGELREAIKEMASLKKQMFGLQKDFSDLRKEISGALKNVQAPTAPDFDSMIEIHTELEERKEKKNRTVVFNLPEPPINACLDFDLLQVQEMASKIKVNPQSVSSVFRDGRREAGRTRILKVTWKDRNDRLDFMRRVRDLRPQDPTDLADPHAKYAKIWSRPDLTWRQRMADQELRTEFKRRKDSGENNIYLKGGKICVKEGGDRDSSA
jgi:hypothetical protein